MHSSGEYLVIRDGDRKKRLVKVIEAPKGQDLLVRREESKVENRRTTEHVAHEDVVVNLGLNPRFGSVYGCKVEVFKSSAEIEGWGAVHYYREMEVEEKKMLKKAAAKIGATLKAKKLTGFWPITFEVRHKSGLDGYYKISKHQNTDVICLKPKEFEFGALCHLIAHEAGHGIYFHMMPNSFKARWVQIYGYYTKLGQLKESRIKEIRRALESAGTLNDVELDKDEVNACLDAVQANFGLRRVDVELLLTEGKEIEPFWPTHKIDLPDTEVVLTDYAMKNHEEFWCEALRIYLTGGMLPKKVKHLMKETLAACKQGKSHDEG